MKLIRLWATKTYTRCLIMNQNGLTEKNSPRLEHIDIKMISKLKMFFRELASKKATENENILAEGDPRDMSKLF